MSLKSAARQAWTLLRGELSLLASRLTLAQRLILSGVVVGFAAGAGTALFDRLIVIATGLSLAKLQGLGRAWQVAGLLIFPAAGALMGGALIFFLCPEAKGHGHDELVKAIDTAEGRIRGNVAWVKSVASALTIGFGGSAGREGPSIQIGGAVGSWIGQKTGVPAKDLKVLVASGAAAGLAAAFGTPLAAVFFTMEVIVKDFASESFPAVVIASVTAVATARFLLGSGRFLVPLTYDWHGSGEFLAYASLGLVVAPFGALYHRLLESTEHWFERREGLPSWVAPGFGGLIVGFVALSMPSVLGTGQPVINAALKGDLNDWKAGASALAKIAATCATLGTGGSGGAFMPALFIGATAGSAWGGLLHFLFNLSVERGGLALTGMACVVTAFYQAPVTAMVMALEISQDYDILMPVMFACVIAYVTTRRKREVPLLAR